MSFLHRCVAPDLLKTASCSLCSLTSRYYGCDCSFTICWAILMALVGLVIVGFLAAFGFCKWQKIGKVQNVTAGRDCNTSESNANNGSTATANSGVSGGVFVLPPTVSASVPMAQYGRSWPGALAAPPPPTNMIQLQGPPLVRNRPRRMAPPPPEARPRPRSNQSQAIPSVSNLVPPITEETKPKMQLANLHGTAADSSPKGLTACLGFPKTEKDLNKCLSEMVRLSEEDKRRYGGVMGQIHTCLTQHLESVAASKVLKSGSLGRGTAIRGHADLDVVVFAKSIVLGTESLEFSTREIFRKYREVFLKSVMWSFQECAVCERSSRRDCALKAPFGFSTTIDGVAVDVLVAYELLPECLVDGVVSWSLVAGKIQGSEFNTSLAELQKRFVLQKIGDCDRVKDLILLVKFWYKRVVRPRYNGGRVPSYLFELLCINHWETILRGRLRFQLLVALRGMLTRLKDPGVLNVFWTVNYSEEEIRSETRIEFPLVLDPVNPANNLAKFEDPRTWTTLSAAAEESLAEDLFRF